MKKSESMLKEINCQFQQTGKKINMLLPYYIVYSIKSPNAGSPFITQLVITQIWIQYSYLVLAKFVTMEFYKGITVKPV